MKRTALFSFSFVLLCTSGQIKPMEGGYKEPAELKFERRSIKVFEEQKDEKASHFIMKNVLGKLKTDNEFKDVDFAVFPPKYVDVKSKYVSEKSADALLRLKAIYLRENCVESKDGTVITQPSRIEVDMNEYDQLIIDSCLANDPNYQDALGKVLLRTKKYSHGFWHGILAASATAGLGYGAWWYFHRNK